MKPFNQHLNESSLSRIWKHNIDHDCGAITAFRVGADCGEGEPYTSKENKQRNKSLMAKLKSAGYGITKLQGTYPEGGSTAKEISYWVVDLNNNGNLEKDIRKFGEMFDQDSVLFVPRGAMNVVKGDGLKPKNVPKAYLIGTNHCKNNWLGYGAKEVFNRGRLGHTSPIYTSMVNGRPFIFEEVGEEVISPASGMGVWMMHRVAEKSWREVSV